VKSGNIVELDDDIASRWGPRIVDLIEQMAAAYAAVTAGASAE
jgi:iron complex transport system substrate-binding protein